MKVYIVTEEAVDYLSTGVEIKAVFTEPWRVDRYLADECRLRYKTVPCEKKHDRWRRSGPPIPKQPAPVEEFMEWREKTTEWQQQFCGLTWEMYVEEWETDE